MVGRIKNALFLLSVCISPFLTWTEATILKNNTAVSHVLTVWNFLASSVELFYLWDAQHMWSKQSQQSRAKRGIRLACKGHRPVRVREDQKLHQCQRKERNYLWAWQKGLFDWGTSQKQKIWATQEKWTNCDMDKKIIRAEGRRGRILQLSPKSVQKSVVVKVSCTVMLLNKHMCGPI